MSKRSDRREAERQARKLAFKQRVQQPAQLAAASEPLNIKSIESQETDLFARAQAYFGAPAIVLASFEAEPEPEVPTVEMQGPKGKTSNAQISEARLQANRANAKLSTGPVSARGKQRSSANALKHALTGKAVLLPTDDSSEYQRQLDMRLRAFGPATEEESELVQSIVDCAWRLNRIKEIETGILLKGQLEFADKHADQSPARRLQLINTETFLKYEKSIRNLNIQEARLLRRMEKDQAKLVALQTFRKREEKLRGEMQRNENQQAENVACNGFEFSSALQPSETTEVAGKTIVPHSLTHASGAIYTAAEQNSFC